MTIDPSSRPSRLPHAALVTYVIALVVGTLYPMSGWHSSGLPVFGFLLDPWPRWWTWFDIVFNIVVYLPGDLLLAINGLQAWTARRRGVGAGRTR